MEDEGVGIHVLKEIEARYNFDPPIECVDGGTAGMELLAFFDEYDKILMIDAVEFRREPGTIQTLMNDEILVQLTEKMSLHHLGITDVLSSAHLLEYNPSEVWLIGVQPKSIQVRLGLSPLMAGKIEELVKLTIAYLQGWGIQGIAKEKPDKVKLP